MQHRTQPTSSVLLAEAGRTIQFVLAHRQPDGGYSFAQSAPSTLEDTYFALMVMRLLAGPPPTRETKDYLSRIEPASSLGPRLLRLLVLARRACGLVMPSVRLIRPFLALEGRLSFEELFDRALLAALYQTRWLRRRDLRARLLALEPLRETETVARGAILWRLQGIRGADLAAWRRWLRGAQGGDGGFGFVPASTSFLEPTRVALQGLRALNASPPDPAACAAFILGCRSAEGGFGRQSRTVPTIEHTFEALEGLRILRSMASHGRGTGAKSPPVSVRTNGLDPPGEPT